MFNGITFSVALTMLLAFGHNCWGTEPAKSVLSGDRPVVYDAPLPLASYSTAMASDTVSSDCGEDCGTSCGTGCGKHGGGHHCHGCNGYHQGHFATRCNMIPHVAYINPMSSYYYFRPYQAFHIREQQAEVTSYGGDPRQPYSNLLFRSIYPELEAAWAEEAATHGSPFEDEVPHEGAPAAEEPKPVDPPAPEINTSTIPTKPIRPRSQYSPIFEFEKPANDTAVLPVRNQGSSRSRR